MPVIRAQSIIKTADAIPENFITNSWCFDVDNAVIPTAALTTAIKGVYDAMVTYLSPAITQNAHEVKFSYLPGVKPNYPFATTTFNLVSAPAGNALPSEVALCLSFQGARTSGLPQARRRGRVYIGPLDDTSNTNGRPAAAFVTALTAAGAGFIDAIAAVTPATEWCVWSITDQAAVPVTDGWVDNAFDTQRRRGLERTSRNLFV